MTIPMRAEDVASTSVRAAVQRVLRDADADSSGPPPIARGGSAPVSGTAESTQRVTASRRVLVPASVHLRHDVRDARAEGVSWYELAEPLGIDPTEFRDLGELAFELIVAFEFIAGDRADAFESPAFAWRCSSCKRRVADRGPYNLDPADNEHGHGERCARHLAEIDAYNARVGA